jgi:hypothetical protein
MRVHQAIHDGTGYAELRTRIETGQVDLVLGSCRWMAQSH